MKLFFLENDSLYKICKTIEKLPAKKEVTIYIEEKNTLFENDRRWKELKKRIDQKKLNATFVAKSIETKNFFKNAELSYEYKYRSKWLKYISLMYMLVFNAKKFHQAMYNKKHYTSYLLFAAEIAVFLVILYMLYALILPSTRVKITPSYEVQEVIYNFRYYPYSEANIAKENKQISIPYYTGAINFTHEGKINTESAITEQTPSKGSITIFNDTYNEYPIIKNTTFITPDGLIYKADNGFIIPAKYGNQKGFTNVNVTASPTDVYNNIMGERGNIKKGKTMHIKNLKDSFFLKKIYATVDLDFQWGTTRSEGEITQQDVQNLYKKLNEYITNNKKDIIRKTEELPEWIFLPFDKLISIDIEKRNSKNPIGSNWQHVEWTITAKLNYAYIKEEHIKQAVKKHLAERQTETKRLMDINMQSLTLYDIKEVKDNTVIIPTALSVIQGYNFNKDKNGIKNLMKKNIAGKSQEQAKNYILSHPEVNAVKISIRPPWYNSIPTTKSRIFFESK